MRLRISDAVSDLLRHVFDAAVLLHQLQRLLRPDSLDAVVEIGADEDREIDERLARDAPAVEQPIELDRLRHDRAERPLARQKLFAGDREEAHEPGRAEQQRVVVFARGGPDVRAMLRPCARPALHLRTAPARWARPSVAAARAPRRPSLSSTATSSSLSSRPQPGRLAPARSRAPLHIAALIARRFAISRALRGGGAPSNTNTSFSACSAMSRVVR